MADGRHFENTYIFTYLSRKSSEYDEIWYSDANFDPGDGNVRKFQKFPNCDVMLTAVMLTRPAPSRPRPRP